MTCDRIHGSLIFYLEGSLSGHEMEAVQQHLTECPECALFLEQLEGSLQVIETEKKIESNPFLITRIEQQIETMQEKKSNSFFPAFQKILQPAMLALLLIASVMAGMKMGESLTPQNLDQITANEADWTYFNEMQQEPIEAFLLDQ